MNDRATNLHTAKVLIREAKLRRRMGHETMAKTLGQWALNARRRARAATQRNLFGEIIG
jgi:hypothetical protein